MHKTKKSTGDLAAAPDASQRHSYLATLARLIAADIDRAAGTQNEKMRGQPIFLKESATAPLKRIKRQPVNLNLYLNSESRRT